MSLTRVLKRRLPSLDRPAVEAEKRRLSTKVVPNGPSKRAACAAARVQAVLDVRTSLCDARLKVLIAEEEAAKRLAEKAKAKVEMVAKS